MSFLEIFGEKKQPPATPNTTGGSTNTTTSNAQSSSQSSGIMGRFLNRGNNNSGSTPASSPGSHTSSASSATSSAAPTASASRPQVSETEKLLREQISDLATRYAEAKMASDTLTHENKRLKDEITRVSESYQAALQELQALQNAGGADSKMATEAGSNSSVHAQQALGAMMSLEQVRTLEGKITALQSELNGLRATSKQTEDEKRRFMELYAHEKKEREVQAQHQVSAKGSVTQLQAENATLKTEKANLEKKLESLEASARSSSEAMMDMQVKMQQLRESFSFAQIQQAHQELSKAKDELKIATSVGEDLQRENDELRASIAAANAETKRLAKRVQKLDDDLARAQRRDQLNQSKIESLVVSVADKEKKLEVFARERATESERWSLREGEIRQEYTVQLATLRERQRTDTASLHERIQVLTAERNALGAQCLSMRTELRQLKAKKDQGQEAKLREELAITRDMLQRKSQSLENIMLMMAEVQANSSNNPGGIAGAMASVSAAVGSVLSSVGGSVGGSSGGGGGSSSSPQSSSGSSLVHSSSSGHMSPANVKNLLTKL